jgi:predicted RNase H-like HicB family nuclease
MSVKVKIKITHYTYRVIWSEDDGEFVGLCAEFPSLSYLAPTPEKAVRGILDVVADVVKDMKRSGEPVPEPLSCQHYSGKFVVRVPPEVHRELTVEAAEENISLNRLVNARLCSHFG